MLETIVLLAKPSARRLASPAGSGCVGVAVSCLRCTRRMYFHMSEGGVGVYGLAPFYLFPHCGFNFPCMAEYVVEDVSVYCRGASSPTLSGGVDPFVDLFYSRIHKPVVAVWSLWPFYEGNGFVGSCLENICDVGRLLV